MGGAFYICPCILTVMICESCYICIYIVDNIHVSATTFVYFVRVLPPGNKHFQADAGFLVCLVFCFTLFFYSVAVKCCNQMKV